MGKFISILLCNNNKMKFTLIINQKHNEKRLKKANFQPYYFINCKFVLKIYFFHYYNI